MTESFPTAEYGEQDDLTTRIAYWQQQVDAISPEVDMFPDALRTEILTDLDGRWRYYDVRCAIKGSGHFQAEPKGSSEQLYGCEANIAYGEATSVGFEVVRLEKDDATAWRICYCFIDDQNFENHPILEYVDEADIETACVAIDADNGVVVPLPELEMVYLESMFQTISEGSRKIVEALHDLTFRQLDGTNQNAALKAYIRIVQKEAHELRALIDEPVRCFNDKAYIFTPDKDSHFAEIAISAQLLSGTIKSLDVLELWKLPEHPIATDEDLIDEEAGLCIVLDPSAETRDALGLGEFQRLWLPVGQHDQLGVHFIHKTDEHKAA